MNKSSHDFELCVKCHLCEDVCPALHADEAYPGPKRSGPDGERMRLEDAAYFDKSVKMCLNCKRCEVACPSGVKIADIIQESKHLYGRHSVSLRDRILASTDFMGSVASPIAPVVNFATGLGIARLAMNGILGIDHHRIFPKYSSKRFSKIFEEELKEAQKAFKKKVSYFHGCYVEYNNPQLGRDFVKVMNALGYGVELFEEEKCCGVPMISSGMFEKAREHAMNNAILINASPYPVLSTSTSCTLMISEEYSNILHMTNGNIKLALRFIYEALQKGAKLNFKSDYKARTAYHKPCHGEKLGQTVFTKELMKMIPGMEMIELESNCCGIAGTYGFKKENYKRSQKIGQPLFDNINELNPDFVVCECETCKWQIEMSTGYTVKNPVSIIAEALL